MTLIQLQIHKQNLDYASAWFVNLKMDSPDAYVPRLASKLIYDLEHNLWDNNRLQSPVSKFFHTTVSFKTCSTSSKMPKADLN